MKGVIFFNPLWVIIFALFYIADMTDVFLLAVCAALLHEAGHILSILMVGGNIAKVRINLSGIQIRFKGIEYQSYAKDIFISLSGPFINLILFAASYFIWQNNLLFAKMSYFCGINIFLFIFNMLPLRFLDGGRALMSFLLVFLDYDYVQHLMDLITWSFSVLLIVAGAAVFYLSGYNVSLLFASIYLLYITSKECARPKNMLKNRLSMG